MMQKEVLKNLVVEYSKIRGIEIGTLAGDTVVSILKEIPNLHMITIDPEPQLDKIKENLGVDKNRLAIVIAKSDDVKFGGMYCFVWIDGDHNYEQVKRDIKNYIPLIKSGGFIGGHDYGSPAYTDVKKAVDEIFKDKQINTGDDYTWWVYV